MTEAIAACAVLVTAAALLIALICALLTEAMYLQEKITRAEASSGTERADFHTSRERALQKQVDMLQTRVDILEKDNHDLYEEAQNLYAANRSGPMFRYSEPPPGSGN